MADRTSAELFCRLFEMLAKDPTPDHVQLAHEVWRLSQDYDFTDEQMGCDDALVKLGLARKGIDPDYPEDGEVMVYGPEKPKKSGRS